jgi:hypothetical protein
MAGETTCFTFDISALSFYETFSAFQQGKSFLVLTAVYIYKEDRNTILSHDAGKQAEQVYKSRRWQT